MVSEERLDLSGRQDYDNRMANGNDTKVYLIREGSKLAGDLIRHWMRSPGKRITTEPPATQGAPALEKPPTARQEKVLTRPGVDAELLASTPSQVESPTLPTTEETLRELRRRLGKELSDVELDLQAGARIAGKPCDCLSAKHNLRLESMAEELMSYEVNPVYGEIVQWLRSHEAEFEPAEIVKRPLQHYQALAPQVREFRKRVMGTADRGALLTAEQMTRVRERVAERSRAQEEALTPLEPETEIPAMRQRARELAGRVRAGELSRDEAVATLADSLANEGKKPVTGEGK